MDSVGIPRQLILTGPGSFLQDLPLEVQRNVEDIITANPTLNVQWFSDADCYSYISYYYDSELAGMFRREFRGSFRGDLCRAAVLYREGGFYVDLDFELLVPLTTLIGVSTTFLSVFAANGAILNALMASTPYSGVLHETLVELRKWYRGSVPRHADPTLDATATSDLMGQLTLHRAVRRVISSTCPEHTPLLAGSQLDWSCGSNDMFRFFIEEELQCNVVKSTSECSVQRARSPFVGLRYGIWTPGSSPSSRSSTNERNQLIGWPRFEACRRWGCGDPNYGLSEEALQVSWMLRERFLPCMCGTHFESGQQLVTELLFSLPSTEQLTPACDRFRPFVETGDLECAAAVVSSSLLCASAAAGAEPLLARAFLARALQAILAGSMLVCYEGMWMVQVDEILDQFYRLHTPEFAYARLNWTRHNHSSEAVSPSATELSHKITRIQAALALSVLKPTSTSSMKVVRPADQKMAVQTSVLANLA